MDSNYEVTGCTSQQRWRASGAGRLAARDAGVIEGGSPFKWWNCSVQRKDTRGVANRRIEAQTKGHNLAKQLKPGMMVAVQDRLNNESEYIIGMTVDVGDKTCIIKQVQDRSERINGTKFDRGDYVVAVQWLVRLAEDSEQRTFELKPDAPQDVFNSTELRCIDVQLDKQDGNLAPVRRSLRERSRVAAQAVVRATKYVVPTIVEQMILVECW